MKYMAEGNPRRKRKKTIPLKYIPLKQPLKDSHSSRYTQAVKTPQLHRQETLELHACHVARITPRLAASVLGL